jgi:hypothetical protein
LNCFLVSELNEDKSFIKNFSVIFEKPYRTVICQTESIIVNGCCMNYYFKKLQILKAITRSQFKSLSKIINKYCYWINKAILQRVYKWMWDPSIPWKFGNKKKCTNFVQIHFTILIGTDDLSTHRVVGKMYPSKLEHSHC